MTKELTAYLGHMSTMSHHPHNQGQIQSHQRPIQQDWANREYIEVITGSIKKISDFLNSFGKRILGQACRVTFPGSGLWM